MADVTATVTKAAASATSSTKVTPQGGILEGGNPSVYDPKNPIILFIIQASIIIIFSRLLHYPLSRLRQPRVIAEVIGGILLGPSVMGHVPGFTNAIFPSTSIPNLNLVANIGLLLFLFLVGLEVDLRYFVSNWKVALSVGTAGMALPFGLGCAIAWGLYNEFRNEPGTVEIPFGTYMLFIGVAMAITAFPVLCRILTELQLLGTPVGIIVLSAGVSNDVVGWILLALCVALVNAGSGLTALWVLLTCVGYALFLVFAVRPVFLWILRRSRALSDGPSQSIVTLTLLIALASSFFTGVIGVHPIFGAFMAGLICPHEGGFAVKLTEKIEDLVSALFLPLYFALSGLSTNLSLLNNGITWAYVVGTCAIAFFGKFAGGTLGARVNGLVWRESFTIGALMSCKGLVELIVLNIGRQANILSTRTFTIFVVMALVTTFATTPLTSWLYPPWYQRKLEAWKRGEIDWSTGRPLNSPSEASDITRQKLESAKIRKMLVYLRLDNMPALLAFISLLGTKPTGIVSRQHPAREKTEADENPTPKPRGVEVYGLRIMGLTERSSMVMKVSEIDEFSLFDPVLNAFRVLGQLFNIAMTGEVTVSPESRFADTLVEKADEESSGLLLLPWSETGSMSEAQTISNDSVRTKLESDAYTTFVTQTLDAAHCTVAVFINKSFTGSNKQAMPALQRSVSHMSLRSRREQPVAIPNLNRSHHIFLPYFGLDADDRVALRLVLQLAENPQVTATIVYYESSEASDIGVTHETLTINTSKQLAAQPAEEVSRTGSVHGDGGFFNTLRHSLTEDLSDRVLFDSVSSSRPLDDALERARAEIAQDPNNGGDIIVLGRHAQHFKGEKSSSSICLGAAAGLMASSGVRASLLVVQASGNASASERFA